MATLEEIKTDNSSRQSAVKRSERASLPEMPSVRGVIDGYAQTTYKLDPLKPKGMAGQAGSALLVPDGLDYYFIYAYVSGESTAGVTVNLPRLSNILVVDLPEGYETSHAKINKALENDIGAGPPGRIGPP